MTFHPDCASRVLDTFDWYSLWYQSKPIDEEVFGWFESCGLDDLTVIEQLIAVQGRRLFVRELSTTGGEEEVNQCAG
jgi:hypothetical protein